MRAAGTKSSLVKILKEETKVTTSDLLPQGDWKTAVVVDGMHAIRRWSFKKNEIFGDIADRYKEQLLKMCLLAQRSYTSAQCSDVTDTVNDD